MIVPTLDAERVARALYERDERMQHDHPPDRPFLFGEWDDLTVDTRETYVDEARHLLAAGLGDAAT